MLLSIVTLKNKRLAIYFDNILSAIRRGYPDIFFAGKFDVISTLFRNCERELLHLLSLDLNLLQRDEAVMILSQGTD